MKILVLLALTISCQSSAKIPGSWSLRQVSAFSGQTYDMVTFHSGTKWWNQKLCEEVRQRLHDDGGQSLNWHCVPQD